MSKEEFLRHLKAYRSKLPRQVVLTLRGQALSGDVDGAIRGLAQILKKKRDVCRHAVDFLDHQSVNVVTLNGDKNEEVSP